MDKLTIGDAILSRIEETADTSFTAEGFFPAFDLEQSPIPRNGFSDSVLPIVEAGRADMIRRCGRRGLHSAMARRGLVTARALRGERAT
jgi:hypothetical protein